MGLFSFVGKALKGISKVAKFVPGIGNTVSKVAGLAGGLLDHKRPMANPKPMARSPSIMRGTSPMAGGMWSPAVLRSTPIMPGGAISTPQGMKSATGQAPPASFGRASRTAVARYQRSAAEYGKRKSRRKRSSASYSPPRKKRRTSGRRLKFGSPAWRKKYMKRR